MAEATKAFLDEVADLFAVYFDAVHGVVLWHDRLKVTQASIAREIGKTTAELDQVPFTYAHGAPGDPNSRLMIEGPQGVIKSRNTKDGQNTHFLGRMLIVAVYQLWEEHYRALIASELGLATKNELRSAVFGELRRLRQAIIHNNGMLTDEGEANRILRWCSRGERVNPSREQITELYFLPSNELTELDHRMSNRDDG